MILLESNAAMTPQGVIIIVVLVVVIILALIYDKKKKASFVSDFQKKYQDRIVEQVHDAFVTSDGEFVLKYDASTVGGYKIFKLRDISYVFCGRDITAKSWCISLLDSEEKNMKGEYVCSSKKMPLVEKNAVTFTAKQKVAEDYCELIMRHAPHVKKYKRK